MDYRLLFEVSPRPMWVADRETRQILLVNEAAVRMYGWSRDEFLAMTLDDIRPPHERATFQAVYRAPKTSPSYARAGRHWKKDGSIIDVDIELTPFVLDGRAASLAIITDITGIADAQRRFQLLVENSAEAIAVTTAQGVVEYVSPATERMLGYAQSEIIGKPARPLVHPEDAASWVPPAPGETSTAIRRALHRDGSWRWIEIMTTNLTHDPAVRAYVSNYRDITARKQAEQAQLAMQRRLEYLLSATSAITYSVVPGGSATFISSSIRTVLGYTPEQFYGDRNTWFRNIHPDDLEGVLQRSRELRRTGELSFDYRFRHANGSWRWIRDSARVERDLHGGLVEIVGYWIDITDQVNAGESLKRSEANFRALIERSPTAMLVQRDGVYAYVNPAFAAVLGYNSPADMIGRCALDDVHPEDRERITERMQPTPTAADISPAEVRVLRRNGSVVVLEVEGMFVDFDGKPSTLAIGRDVTERREMFERMALADRMLTVGTLAAGVAHEINNPLAYVASNLEVLASEVASVAAGISTRLPVRDLPGLIADARDGVARVSAIVHDLRALSRPDDDSRGPVDVVAVLASSIKMAHNEIRHHARVAEHHEPDLPPVFAHASRLGQVFLNLLFNAAQAIPEGRADQNEIRIRAMPSVDRRQVHVEIEDTGIGIPASQLRRIFDPFFTTKAPGIGMGLGLAISHQILRSMDGEITVESHPGVGTTFRVSLPVATMQKPLETLRATRLASSSARILFIDDEPALGRSLRVLLGDHEVVSVTCARDALAKLAGGECFDVILCDLMMPDISGIDLYSQIAPAHQERVVFMTGGAFTPQARDFLARCDRPWLDKPFSEYELRDAIERVRSNPGVRSGPTPVPA
jgi:PAS domain S-box-containing protein